MRVPQCAKCDSSASGEFFFIAWGSSHKQPKHPLENHAIDVTAACDILQTLPHEITAILPPKHQYVF